MNPLLTIIAELEEAERAATAGKWDWDAGLVPPDGPERYADIYAGETIIANFNDAIPEGRANARLIALMRTHLPTLIEAVKRQGGVKYCVKVFFKEGNYALDEQVRRDGEALGGRMNGRMYGEFPESIYVSMIFDDLPSAQEHGNKYLMDTSRGIFPYSTMEVEGWQNWGARAALKETPDV